MDPRVDKLGEYVMFAEEFNRFEVFAAAPENYATLHQDEPEASHPGAFWLLKQAGQSNEKRIVVHSDHVYGAERQIERLLFDVVYVFSSWQYGDSYPPGGTRWAKLDLHVRAVTSDFDPTTITWNWAYVTDGGHLTFAQNVAGVTTGSSQFSVPAGSVSVDQEWASLFPLKRANSGGDMPPDSWNSVDAIYGFELRLVFPVFSPGNNTKYASYAGLVTDGTPSGLGSRCWVVLK